MVIDLPKAIRVPCGLLEASERDVACSLFVCFFLFFICVCACGIGRVFFFFFSFFLHGLNLSRPCYQFYFYNWSGLGSTSKLF
jgi:hypothetical protein